jgi:hypothetical protein
MKALRTLPLIALAAIAVSQPTALAQKNDAPLVLSAFFGDTVLPQAVNVFCPPPTEGLGYGGMPIVFSKQLDPQGGYAGAPFGFDPALFRVWVRGNPKPVTPLCATLVPAIDDTELRTLLLTGEFGFGGLNIPRRIDIVGDIRTVDYESLKGLRIRGIEGPDAGPTLVLAEQFIPGASDIGISPPGIPQAPFCPAGQTAVVVKLTFSGGVTAINGDPLQDDPDAMDAIELVGIDADGNRVVLTPFALRDVDPDNHLDACFDDDAAGLTLDRIAVNSDVFYSPQNAPNPAGTVFVD